MFFVPVADFGVKSPAATAGIRDINFVTHDYHVIGVVGIVELVGDIKHKFETRIGLRLVD